MKNIHISKDIQLPLYDFMTMKTAIVGGNGSGKTYLTGKIIEQILKNNGWVIVLDPVGIHYGVRLTKTGKPSQFDIPVFGGRHGDLPLRQESGKIIADILTSKKLSSVLDVSYLSDEELNIFVTDFAYQFFQKMKERPRPVTLILEEAQVFIPQVLDEGGKKKRQIFNKIVQVGRNHGIGVIMITPRPQEVAKNSFNLSQAMFAFQMTGINERAVVEKWFEHEGMSEDVYSLLPNLKIGQPYVTIPRMGINKKIRVDEKETFDSSNTPKFVDDDEPITLSKIDISNLEKQMESVIKKEQETNPAWLRQKIRELEMALSSQPERMVPVEKIVEVKVPIVDEQVTKQISDAQSMLESIQGDISIANSSILGILKAISDTTNQFQHSRAPIPAQKRGVTANLSENRSNDRYTPVKQAKNAHFEASENIDSLPKGEFEIVAAIFQLGDRTRTELQVVTGYAKSSIDKYINKLQTKALVHVKGKYIFLTEAGVKFAELASIPVMPQGEELQKYWFHNLPKGEADILAGIISCYPQEVHRDEIPTNTKYASSSVDKYINKLRNRSIVTVTRPGYVRASDHLF